MVSRGGELQVNCGDEIVGSLAVAIKGTQSANICLSGG